MLFDLSKPLECFIFSVRVNQSLRKSCSCFEVVQTQHMLSLKIGGGVIYLFSQILVNSHIQT